LSQGANNHLDAGIRSVEALTPAVIREECPNLEAGAAALFDIDSTVMNTAPRNLQILREAAGRWPELESAVAGISPDELGWNIFEPLEKSVSLTPDLREAIHVFWKKRFFTDAYVLFDEPYPKVRELLEWLRGEGIRLVYLTGRDGPNMSSGKIDSFSRHGLPLDQGTRFIFKPTFEEADATFKALSCAELAREERVVLAVENEPGNANLMHRQFPDALTALIETVTSPNPERPEPGILRFSRYSV